MIRMGKVAGYVRIDDPEKPTQEFDTLMCVHCNKHWTVQPGSGATRGFCLRCMGPHCGAPDCWRCVPLERQIEEGLARLQLAKALGLQEK